MAYLVLSIAIKSISLNKNETEALLGGHPHDPRETPEQRCNSLKPVKNNAKETTKK